MKSRIGHRYAGRDGRSLLMHLPLLLLLLLLDGWSGSDERLLWRHHVMDGLEIALRPMHLHLHRLLLLMLLLHLLLVVLDHVAHRSVRMLEMLLLLLQLLLRLLVRHLMVVNDLLLLMLLRLWLDLDLLLNLVLDLLLDHVRMESSRRRQRNGSSSAGQDIGFEFLKVRVGQEGFILSRSSIRSRTERLADVAHSLAGRLLVLHVLSLQFPFLLFQQIFQQKRLFLLGHVQSKGLELTR